MAYLSINLNHWAKPCTLWWKQHFQSFVIMLISFQQGHVNEVCKTLIKESITKPWAYHPLTPEKVNANQDCCRREFLLGREILPALSTFCMSPSSSLGSGWGAPLRKSSFCSWLEWFIRSSRLNYKITVIMMLLCSAWGWWRKGDLYNTNTWL